MWRVDLTQLPMPHAEFPSPLSGACGSILPGFQGLASLGNNLPPATRAANLVGWDRVMHGRMPLANRLRTPWMVRFPLPEGERRPTGIRGPFSNGPHRAGDRMQLRLNGTPIMVEVHSVP
jgi:hypothetical protein